MEDIMNLYDIKIDIDYKKWGRQHKRTVDKVHSLIEDVKNYYKVKITQKYDYAPRRIYIGHKLACIGLTFEYNITISNNVLENQILADIKNRLDAEFDNVYLEAVYSYDNYQEQITKENNIEANKSMIMDRLKQMNKEGDVPELYDILDMIRNIDK